MKPLVLLSALLTLSSSAVADWRSDADARIERVRKGDLAVELRGADGKPVKAARVEFQLKRHDFHFGTAINNKAFSDRTDFGRAYRQFILDHLSGLVCENEMKWYYTEVERGRENYAPADALLAFAEENDPRMRGHCLFWAKPKYVQPWVQALEPKELRAAVERRLTSVATRYAGRLVSWDVNNEMLDGEFFREHLGADAPAWMFKEAARTDPKTPMFVNEYAIFGNPEKTDRYIALIRDLKGRGAPVAGIGVQSHDTDRLTDRPDAKPLAGDRPDWMMNTPVSPESLLATLEKLHSETGLPIHLTEISARTDDDARRGEALEMLFRLGFSHASVEAILLWGFDAKTHWMGENAALMLADGTLNPAGTRISNLLREEWLTRGSNAGVRDGRLAFRGFYGKYALSITLPDGRKIEREVRLSKAAPTAVVNLGG